MSDANAAPPRKSGERAPFAFDDDDACERACGLGIGPVEATLQPSPTGAVGS